jgi:IclR family transcriptional regulator, acetate operon repressor
VAAPYRPAAHAATPKANRSIEKAVALLHAAARSPEGATVTTLAKAVGIPRATASRLLATLQSQGLVQRMPDNDRYTLGYELGRLGRAVDLDRGLVLATRAMLEQLAAEFRETVTLAVPRPGPGFDVICQIDAPRAIRIHDWSVDPQPLHAASTGKLVLAECSDAELEDVLRGGLTRYTAATIVEPEQLRAELARVRRQDWAQMVDELEYGLTAVSVPLRDERGRLTAAIGITGPTQRMGFRERARAVKAVRAGIAELHRPQGAAAG